MTREKIEEICEAVGGEAEAGTLLADGLDAGFSWCH